MNKKAISPLIAWVLIIGFSISMGLLITQWAIKYFSDIEYPEDNEVYCNDVSFDIEDICVSSSPDNDNIKINISNKGLFSIRRLSISRQTTSYPEEWCDKLNVEIKPGQKSVIDFLAGSSNLEYSNTIEIECDLNLHGGYGFNQTHNLTEIKLTPWIKIENDSFHCIGKEIVLNNITLLNKICT